MNEPNAERKYQAFISYSHAADGQLAPAVQKAVRRFGKSWYSPSSRQIFRDGTGLGLTPDLWGEIRQGLEQSQCFILLASPEAAQSQWVEQEVRHWLQHRAADPLLILLTGGKLSWSKEQNDFDWDQSNALPRTLQGFFKVEPLWANLSEVKTDADLSLRNPRFFVEIAKLVAGMRRVPLDKVFDEAAVQQQQARRLLWATGAALVLLTILAVAAATVSFRSIAHDRRVRADALQKQRGENARQAKEAASVQLAAKAAAVFGEDPELSRLLALAALDIAPTRAAEDALRRTLLELNPPLILQGHSNIVHGAQFSSDGRRVLTSGGDGTVRLWDAFSGTNVLTLRVQTNELRFLPGSYDGLPWHFPGDIAFGILSQDTTRVLTLTKPTEIMFGPAKSSAPKLYDATTGALLVEIPDQSALDAALSPDNALIVTAGFNATAKLWDARTGKIRFNLAGHEQRVESASFSSNGTWVVTGSWDETARVWETGTGRCLAVLKIPGGKGVNVAAFSPDDSRVITLCDERKELHLWDWAKRPGAPVATFVGHEGSIRAFAFSADGQWLATASFDRTARIWETATGKCLHILSGHEEFVAGVDFSPNGRWVVTASGDRTAQIWDAATGENLMPLGGNDSPRTGVAFSPDGQRIVTGTTDGTVLVYDCTVLGSVSELRALAAARGHRELTPEERQKYLSESPGK